jgi:hypothetical protein
MPSAPRQGDFRELMRGETCQLDLSHIEHISMQFNGAPRR